MKKKSNRKYLVYSIAIALIVWYFASTQVDPLIESSINVPITIKNSNELSASGKTFEISEPLVAKVSYYVRTSKADEMLSSMLNAYVDFSELPSESENNDNKPALKDGENTVPLNINIDYNGNQKNIYVYDISPKMLHAYVDEIATKDFNLTYRSEGILNSGYALDEVSLANETVKISGSSRDLNKIAEASVVVNVNNRNSAWTDVGIIKYYDKDGAELTSLNVKSNLVNVVYSASLSITQVIRISQDYMGTCADGYGVKSVKLSPDTITVSYPLSRYATERTIVLPAVDVSGANESITRRVDISNLLGANTKVINGSRIIDIEVEVVPLSQLDISSQDTQQRSNIIILPRATRSETDY